MALTEQQEHVVTVLPDGVLQIRRDTVIKRDGQEISRLHHRYVLDPATADIQQEPAQIQAISGVVWTPDIKAARLLALARARDL